MKLRRLLPLLLLALLPPASAVADGPPVTSLDAGPDGVVEPGGADRFAAFPTRRATVVTRSQTHGGRVLRAGVLSGRWGLPVVANDGTSAGLSADGHTLVLIRAARAYPRRHTSLAVVDARRLTVWRTVALKGEWGFDAISPDGSTLYLIEQLSRRDRSRYAVRAYDLSSGRLLPDPIVDPSEPDEPMRGLPVTRTTGPGGRWEYTLYAGGEHPFVHALDTVGRESICIDLPHRIGRRGWIWEARLAIDGGTVKVLHGERVVTSAPRRARQASAGGGSPWTIIALALTGAFVAAGGVRRLTRSG